jgi:hypothetical protein
MRRTQQKVVSVWDDQQKLKGVVNFYYTFQIYPDMFRQVVAIFRGLHVPYKLLQYCLCFGRMWIMVRSGRPAAVEFQLSCVRRISLILINTYTTGMAPIKKKQSLT